MASVRSLYLAGAGKAGPAAVALGAAVVLLAVARSFSEER